MKTNKRFLLAAILGLALTFTISCSSDDGGATVSCKYVERSVEICSEISGDIAAKHKKEIQEECIEYLEGTPGDSCPSGSKLKCDDDGEKVYIYSDMFKTCDEAFNYLGW